MRINWNGTGQKTFESGVDRGVLYPNGGNGVPWNGLISIEETPSGGSHTPLYFDGVKYLDFIESEEYAAVIEAYGAPAEFSRMEGSHEIVPGLIATHQLREPFSFTYRTGIGNDVDGETHGYKLHLVYGATVLPSTKSHKSRGAEIEPTIRSWAVVAVPPAASDYRPTAHLEIDSTRIHPGYLKDLEDFLYGTSTKNPSLPTIAEVSRILSNTITEPLGALV